MEKGKIMITMPDGTVDEVEEVISFQFKDTNKQYVVYTRNEVDEAGNVTIYVTEMVKDEKGTRFVGISSEDEWNKIKDALRALANQN